MVFHYRFIRRIQQETREAEMQKRIALTEKEREQKRQQLDQEERLSKELENLKWEKEKDERYRQQIRENRYSDCYGIFAWPAFCFLFLFLFI